MKYKTTRESVAETIAEFEKEFAACRRERLGTVPLSVDFQLAVVKLLGCMSVTLEGIKEGLTRHES